MRECDIMCNVYTVRMFVMLSYISPADEVDFPIYMYIADLNSVELAASVDQLVQHQPTTLKFVGSNPTVGSNLL